MEAAAKWRVQIVRENAAEDVELWVRVPIEETWPEWHCDDCGQFNDRWRIVCGMCGVVREDLDSLG